MVRCSLRHDVHRDHERACRQHLIAFERAHGTTEALRKVFKDSVNAVADYPEQLCQVSRCNI